MGEFRMPSLGADMEHGKVVEWLVKPGDYVRRGDVVAVVDTEKAMMDVETFEEGVVAELLADVGATVPVGGPLARITQTPAAAPAPEPRAAAAEARPAAPPPVRHLAHRLGVDTGRIRGTGRSGAVTRSDVEHAAAAAAVPPVTVPAPVTVPVVPVVPGPAPRPAPRTASGAEREETGRIRSSPRARWLAAELGVDLAKVPGTGPDGAVTESDVRSAVPAAAPAAEPEPRPAGPQPAGRAPEAVPGADRAERAERAAGLRHAIGVLMAKSKKSIPHYYLSTTLDLRAAVGWMQEVNARRPVSARLVPSALLLKAAALAAREVPEMNGFYTNGAFRPSDSVHLGVAVALRRGGLVAPAIHDADSLPVDALMEQLRDLVARARGGRLQRAEMADPTITVTNLGDLGVESVFGVIYPPQVAMVGFGRVSEQPWAQDGMLGIRPAAVATLSADHRVSDGLRGGRFLSVIDELLQKPEEL
ncbi:2-oxo acid dehydrogenase subunit E2 [Paenarthrobacter sp. DKR-5]|uniref:dihydrolipoamide acetyltransferase family protein n=1 Tax=Paenarthrobacter sp. DKR-5 TaxID=2835535 RepID=UPI001BDBF342|nr:dihydrolipoamide acetyltransferase family protein [Paenarthrobacter sp. DKR-5]MBT1001957.1 2-oxo acid dehydrogenase subunit E2 [Paenarthrobacter sp. DKR-5]